jgi:hypothetical protein
MLISLIKFMFHAKVGEEIFLKEFNIRVFPRLDSEAEEGAAAVQIGGSIYVLIKNQLTPDVKRDTSSLSLEARIEA